MSTTSTGSIVGHNRGSPTSAPIQEENEDGSHYRPGQRSSINDLSLFSSPSMPNISLGRPHLQNAHNSAAANYAMLAALRQHAAAGIPPPVGAPTAGHQPPTYYNPMGVPFGRQPVPGPNSMISSTTPSNTSAAGSVAAAPPQSPVVRSASATSTSSSQASLVGDVAPPLAHAASTGCATALMHVASTGGIHAVVAHSPQSSSSSSTIYGQPITDAQVAQAHLNKQGHRPLGRTQSAPLPLGHPMLTGSSQINIAQTHYENSDVSMRNWNVSTLY